LFTSEEIAMRSLLFLALLSTSLASVSTSDADTIVTPVTSCIFCYYPNICYAHTYGSDTYLYCIQGPGGVYLAPKRPTWPFAATDHTIEFYKEVDAIGIAAILNEGTGWGVDAKAVEGSTFKPGSYKGTVADIAKEIAASIGANAILDQDRQMITITFEK